MQISLEFLSFIVAASAAVGGLLNHLLSAHRERLRRRERAEDLDRQDRGILQERQERSGAQLRQLLERDLEQAEGFLRTLQGIHADRHRFVVRAYQDVIVEGHGPDIDDVLSMTWRVDCPVLPGEIGARAREAQEAVFACHHAAERIARVPTSQGRVTERFQHAYQKVGDAISLLSAFEATLHRVAYVVRFGTDEEVKQSIVPEERVDEVAA